MKTETIDLKPFCSKSRAGLLKPWTQDGKTVATDGRIIVVMPAKCKDSEQHLNIDDLWRCVPKFIPAEAWQVIPKYPPVTTEDCDECFGVGENYCLWCAGTGKQPKSEAVSVGNKHVSNIYLALMSALPGLRIAPAVTKELEPMPFRFDGGHGLLMPISMSK